MATKTSDLVIPTELADKIRAAANRLMEDAPPMVDDNPTCAIAALCLAASTASAFARIPYTEFIDLVSKYYESTLKAEIKLEESGKLKSAKSQWGPN